MGKTLELNNNNNREMDVLKRIEERKAQQDLDETKRVNTRKQQLHYLFLFIVCLLILDSLGWISMKTNFISITGIVAKIISCFPKMNSS